MSESAATEIVPAKTPGICFSNILNWFRPKEIEDSDNSFIIGQENTFNENPENAKQVKLVRCKKVEVEKNDDDSDEEMRFKRKDTKQQTNKSENKNKSEIKNKNNQELLISDNNKVQDNSKTTAISNTKNEDANKSAKISELKPMAKIYSIVNDNGYKSNKVPAVLAKQDVVDAVGEDVLRGEAKQSFYSSSYSSSEESKDQLTTFLELHSNEVKSMVDESFSAKYGCLYVVIMLDSDSHILHVMIQVAKNLPNAKQNPHQLYHVHVVLLPRKKRFKTKIKSGEFPEFNQVFRFPKVSSKKENLLQQALRFRIFVGELYRKEILLGEVVVGLGSLELSKVPTQYRLILEPTPRILLLTTQYELDSDSDESIIESITDIVCPPPELLLAMSYNPITGSLIVDIIRAINMTVPRMQRPADVFVKITIFASNGQELTRSKTFVKSGQVCPSFKQSFKFSVAMFQFNEVNVKVAVYHRKSMTRKELIGWINFGLNPSGEETAEHWKAIVDQKGESVTKWHTLIQE